MDVVRNAGASRFCVLYHRRVSLKLDENTRVLLCFGKLG
jgi:hypothetical protein